MCILEEFSIRFSIQLLISVHTYIYWNYVIPYTHICPTAVSFLFFSLLNDPILFPIKNILKHTHIQNKMEKKILKTKEKIRFAAVGLSNDSTHTNKKRREKNTHNTKSTWLTLKIKIRDNCESPFQVDVKEICVHIRSPTRFNGSVLLMFRQLELTRVHTHIQTHTFAHKMLAFDVMFVTHLAHTCYVVFVLPPRHLRLRQSSASWCCHTIQCHPIRVLC